MPIKIDRSEEKIIFRLRELPEEKKSEVLDFIDFLKASRENQKEGREGERFSYYLEKLRKKIQARGGLELGKTENEILRKLRKTRQKIWKEDYESYFGRK